MNEVDKAHLPYGHQLAQKRSLFYSVTHLQWYHQLCGKWTFVKEALTINQVVDLHIHSDNIAAFVHAHPLLENLLTGKLSEEDVKIKLKA